MVLEWDEGAHASRYAVQLSMDGRSFRDARQATEGNGGTDWIALPESEARYVGVVVQGGPGQPRPMREARERKSAGLGKSVSVRLDRGGSALSKKKKKQ